MLSYMKDEDDQANVTEDKSSSDDSSSEKTTSVESAGASSQTSSQTSGQASSQTSSQASGQASGQVTSQVASLNETLKADGGPESSSQDYLAPSSTGVKTKYSTLILGVVFLVGAASLFLIITKFGPGDANAAPSAEDQKIDIAIAKLTSKTVITDKMNDIVDRISSMSAVKQVSVDDLKRNPFILDSSERMGSGDSDYSGSDFVLWSVMESDGQKSCMINDRLYKVGDQVGNYTVKRIGAGFAELTAGQELLVLRMSK
jgi:hypothetical protein